MLRGRDRAVLDLVKSSLVRSDRASSVAALTSFDYKNSCGNQAGIMLSFSGVISRPASCEARGFEFEKQIKEVFVRRTGIDDGVRGVLSCTAFGGSFGFAGFSA